MKIVLTILIATFLFMTCGLFGIAYQFDEINSENYEFESQKPEYENLVTFDLSPHVIGHELRLQTQLNRSKTIDSLRFKRIAWAGYVTEVKKDFSGKTFLYMSTDEIRSSKSTMIKTEVDPKIAIAFKKGDLIDFEANIFNIDMVNNCAYIHLKRIDFF